MGQRRDRRVNLEEVSKGDLLLELEVCAEEDVLLARRRIKQVARLLGFRGQALTQLATAGMEIIRGTIDRAGAVRVEHRVGGDEKTLLLWVVVDAGAGCSEAGIATEALVDLYQVVPAPDRTTIVLEKRLRRQRPSESQLLTIKEKIARTEPRATLEEAQDQNRELMSTLDELRSAKEQESLRAREWQTTFDTIPDALCLLDDRRTVLRVNHAMVAFLDRAGDELTGRCWRELSPFSSPNGPVEDLLERAEATRCRASGDQKLHDRWYRIQADALLGASSEVRRFVLLIVDITEEKRASERLSQINEALKTYAHSISHDIKGPLAGAITANQVLQQLLARPLTDRSRSNISELGSVISTSINKALTLINEVLALAETGAGPGGTTSVRRVIEQVLEDRRKLIEERRVEVELDGELGQVMAAPAHLYQVFANLVDNAIKHAGRSELTINIRSLEAPEGAHRFLFRDDGRGVPEGSEERIFDSFVQADPTSEGCGIGLATVKRIVATYGGAIRAYNDSGACFDIVIRDAVA